MKMLSLDLGTNFGFAWFEDGELIWSGNDKLVGKKRGMKMECFYNWLVWQLAKDFPDVVAWEAVSPGHFQAVKFLTKMEGIVEMLTYGVENKTVHASTLKKWMTGYGRAKKEDMIQGVNHKTGLSITDDNESDAVAVGLYFLDPDR